MTWQSELPYEHRGVFDLAIDSTRSPKVESRVARAPLGHMYPRIDMSFGLVPHKLEVNSSKFNALCSTAVNTM